MAPGLVETAEQLAALPTGQLLQFGPQLEEFTGGQEDGGEGLHHNPGEFQIFLHHQELRETAVNVLAGEQDTQLADDETPLRLQEVSVSTELFEEALHELLEVGGGQVGAFTASLGGGDLGQNLQVQQDDLVRGVGQLVEEDGKDVVDVLEHLHRDLDKQMIDPAQGGYFGWNGSSVKLFGQDVHNGRQIQFVFLIFALNAGGRSDRVLWQAWSQGKGT